MRLHYVLAVVLSIFLFNSCYNGFVFKDTIFERDLVAEEEGFDSAYGTYLAGRVAHLRQDFGAAADYYVKALNDAPENKEILGRVYIILTSEGRIKEAAKYAELSEQKGDRNNFTHIIIAVESMKEGNFAKAQAEINKLQGPVYREFIIPLISSWVYVGENNKEKALAEIRKIKNEPSFRALYYFHAGMINDYFKDNQAAEENYNLIAKEDNMEMSFRALQVITNFYVRTGQKEKAIALMSKFNDDRLFVDMLKRLNDNIEKSDAKSPALIDNANDGLAEALFSIAATLRQGAPGIDLAHIFICLAIYSNPEYDLAKLLLADILETRGMYNDAIKVYDEIKPDSVAYFSAQAKKATDYISLKDYANAEKLLRDLAKSNPENPQIYLDLGDVLRIQDKQTEAIKFYQESIKSIKKVEDQHWILFYALAISYERNNQWIEAEKEFRKALEMSHGNYMVLNYLGYCLLKNNQDIDNAFGMIVDAYNQAPQDGNIIDSLGWAFYQLGMFDKSIKYLEKASELEAANAVVYDHLGDAYWQTGRKIEARYQWSHSLKMKDETKELKPEEVKKKIKVGIKGFKPLTYDKAKIDEIINTIKEE